MHSHILEGRWDLVVHHPAGDFPSWLEITGSTGRFVGQVGSARPIASLKIEGDHLEFSLPPQYETRSDDLKFVGLVLNGELDGQFLSDEGHWVRLSGKVAPALPRHDVEVWAKPVELVRSDLSTWHARWPEMPNHWSIVEGGLDNATVGTDLITNGKISDFKLIAEYRYPSGSNSGIYLRGRYEFQIVDDYGAAPHIGGSGAIYGFLAPSENAINPPGEWNRAEITLIGRWVTVVLNGKLVIDAEIPGITGGALDSDEGAHGPILIQGDHGPVTFRRLSVFHVNHEPHSHVHVHESAPA